MAKLNDFEKQYLGRQFINGGGYTTKEYDTFQTKYVNYLRSVCKDNGWTLAKVGKMHYEFSVFIKDANGRFVYLAISDVRYWQDQWYTHILIRSAKSDRDYTGGTNRYTDLPDLAENVRRIFDEMERKEAAENAQ